MYHAAGQRPRHHTVFNDLSKEMNMLKKLLFSLTLILALGFVWGQGLETFDNMPATGSAYGTGTFTGQDGSTWNYVQCRSDVDVTGKSCMLGRNRTPQSNVYSGTISGGIGTLSFNYMQAYSTNVNLNVLVNGNVVGNVTSSGQQNVILNSGTITVNVPGDFVIKFINVNNSDGQVCIDDVTWTAYGGIPPAALPVITPGTGNFYAPFNASISCSTPGASIYYTTNGTDPNQTSNLYSGPISISQTTTLKARAYAAGYDPSQIASVTYTFPTVVDVANIAALRAGATDGTVYRLTGTAILTFQYNGPNYNQYYLQDSSAAIMIYDNAGIITTTYNQFDGINNIVGTIALYNGLVELIPEVNTPPAVSSGNSVTPIVKNIADITSDDQSKLIRINGVTFSDTGNFAAGRNYTFTDASMATGTMRTSFASADYIGTAIPNTPGDLVCLVGWYNAAQVTPRNLAGFLNFTTAPYMEVDPAILDGFSYVVGSGPSTAQSFTVSGADLTADIILTAPTHYEISLSETTGYTSPLTLTQTGGAVPTTTIYARLKSGLAVGEYNNEVINITSTGATALTVTCSGEITAPPPPDAPVALEETNVGLTSFKANWEASTGATGYYLDVFTITPAIATDLIISEYIEGSNNNKALEIYNGTGVDVDLSDYTIHLYSNGSSTPSTTNILEMTGTLANGDVYVVAHASAAPEVQANADTTSTVTYYNGDDAIALYKESTASNVDIFGCIGEDPGAAWTSGDHSTVDKTLVRKLTVTGGVSVNPSAGFPTLTTEWDVYPVNTFSYLGYHVMGTFNYVAGYQNLNVGNVTSYTVSGLTAGTTYYYVVRAYNAQGSSDNSNTIEVNSVGGMITISPIQENELFNLPGYPSDEYNTYQVVGSNLIDPITVAAPTHFEVSTSANIGFAQTIELPYNFSGNIYVRLNSLVVGTHDGLLTLVSDGVQASQQLEGETIEPTVTWNIIDNLTAFSHEVGTPSAHQTYTLSATGTTVGATLNLTMSGPFEISTSASGPWSATLELAYNFNGSVYVRMNSNVDGYFTGSILHETANASPATVELEGTAIPAVGYLASELFFSEYIEGSGNNKAIEIFNGTGAPVDLSDYQFENWYNGLLTPSTVPLSGTLANGSVIVLANPAASAEILALAAITSGNVSFNGDDALALRKISTDTLVDIFGCIGEDPGTEWTADGGYSTLNKTLVRKPTVTGGVTENPATGFPTLSTEWNVYDVDTFTYLGSHNFNPGSGLDSPVVQISLTGGIITLTWDAITGATAYEIWSSTDPYGTYTLAQGNWTSTTWTESSAAMKFYKVIAKN